MRILVGYNGHANLNPQTRYAVSRWAYGNRIDFLDVSGSPTAYWHAIRERWTGDEDLVIIEQDIVIAPQTIPSFNACVMDWCSYEYVGPDHLPMKLRWSLGCTKFSAALQRQIPADQIAGDYMVWFLIDERFHKLFRMHGFKPHVHGEVTHLHDYAADSTPEERRDAAVVYNLLHANDIWNDFLFT